MKAEFLTDLDTRDIDGCKSKLIAPLAYRSIVADGIIVAPRDFVTDWASIPQIAQAIIPRNGLYDFASVIHDVLYGYNGAVPVLRWNGHVSVSALDREGCDNVLLEAMRVKNVPEKTAQEIYLAVRLGGTAAWNAHSGESNVYPIEAMLSFRDSMKSWNDPH